MVLVSPAMVPLARADAPKNIDPKIAKNITITGCLHAGENSGEFVLVGATEKTATGAIAAVPYAIYMLNTTRDMKGLVGELVDIRAVVVSKDAKRGTIRVMVEDDAANTTDVKVETGSGDATTTKDFAGRVGRRARESVVEVSRPVYRVNVDSISAVSGEQAGPACK